MKKFVVADLMQSNVVGSITLLQWKKISWV